MTPIQRNRASAQLLRLWRLRPEPKTVPIQMIADQAIERICRALGVSVNNVKSDSREHARIMPARYIITHYLHEECSIGYTEIGRIMNRSHASIIKQSKQYDNLTSTKDKKFMALVEKVKMI